MLMCYMAMIEGPEARSKFEQLYLEYRGLMYHIAFGILNNDQDAEDMVHEAFVKVAENMDMVDEAISSKTKGLLVTIVENKAIDLCRVRSRHPEVPFEEVTIGIQVDYSGAFDLARCFAKLTPRCRSALTLKYHYCYTNKEIGALLGITEDSAKKLVQRARAKLIQACKEDGYDY